MRFLTIITVVAAICGCGAADFVVTPRPGDICETWDAKGAVRCYNPHGICYVHLDGVDACQCNGDDAEETRVLCAEAEGFCDAGTR